MKKVRIAFVGAGGYAGTCLKALLDDVPKAMYTLAGVADPYIEQASLYRYFVDNHIPAYNTVDALLDNAGADAVYIASPVAYHTRQCLLAIKHRCAVFCEKPLAPRMEDVLRLQRAHATSRLPFGVGFQWSFLPAFIRAKQDIINGVYGRPVMLKSLVAWQRNKDYYATSTWKGRIRDAEGNWIMDSVATNAAAHHLHNIFFMLGDELDAAAMPVSAKASLRRANPIESFDTCSIMGAFDSGARFLYLATHSADSNIQPMLSYTFEKGQIDLDMNVPQPVLRGMAGGRTIEYGRARGPHEERIKLISFLEACAGGQTMLSGIRSVIPYTRVTNALFETARIRPFPSQSIMRTDPQAGCFVKGLGELFLQCFKSGKPPANENAEWEDTVLF